MVHSSMKYTSQQRASFSVCCLVLLYLEDSGLILEDNLSTVTPIISITIMFFSNVTQLILQLVSVYTDLMVVEHLMKLMEKIITIHSSVVYLVVVLILLPTSSLLIYLVSYISYCTSTHCHLLLIYFRTCSNLKLQCC